MPIERRQPGWKQPLRNQLNLLIIALLLVIALPLTWLAYQRGIAAATEAAQRQMQLLSRRAVDQVNELFSAASAVVAMVSVSQVLLSPPPTDVDRKIPFLLRGLSLSPAIDGVYVGYPDGDFIHAVSLTNGPSWRNALSAPSEATFALRLIRSQQARDRISSWSFINESGQTISEAAPTAANFDPRSRLWYRLASVSDVSIAVGPYVTATTHALSLTIARRFDQDPKTVVGVDVMLTTLSRYLSEERVSPNAISFMFDRTGRTIIHSDPSKMEQILDELAAGPKTKAQTAGPNDPLLAAVRKALLTPTESPERVITLDSAGETYLAQITTLQSSSLLSGSTIVSVAPLSDFTERTVRLLRHELIIAGAIILVGAACGLLFARLITNSLSALTRQANRIGNLDLAPPAPLRSSTIEIDALDSALGTARQAIQSFAYYVPRELVRRIVESGQATGRIAAQQEVSILFTDIRDFTTISEAHTPEEVVSMLSDYFELMNRHVEAHRGTIVQFIGDSVYAMWNAPIPDPTHARDACRCTLALKTAVERYNQRNRAMGKPEFVTRFGINSGAVVVGNVGAEHRIQYTAMGDTVNVASRLEGLNKELGTTILVSAAVRNQCGADFFFRPLGFQHAKGREEQIEVFELVDVTGASTSA